MKRVEITVPSAQEDDAAEVINEYTTDVTVSEAEKDDRKVVQFQLTLDSDDIDALTEELKDIKELESGELTIEILQEAARIEKGERRQGGSMTLSVQEMYSKAFDYSDYSNTSWALIALGAAIAVLGVQMDNVMVVIGAMVIAPMLGPFIAASFGLVIGDRKIIQDSILYGAGSILFAVGAAFVISSPLPTNITPVMRLIADPGFATIPLSLFVGSAAALTFATEAREALAGVAVAIALVPPSAVAGMSLAMGAYRVFIDVGLVLMTNVFSLILAGSVTFKLMRITPSTYYRQKVSEEKLRQALIVSTVIILLLGGVVGYLSYQDLQTSYTETRIDGYLQQEFGNRILRQSIDVTDGTVEVQVAVVDPQHTETELRQRLSQLTARDITVDLVAVEGTG